MTVKLTRSLVTTEHSKFGTLTEWWKVAPRAVAKTK